jgi:hypothetical protein
LKKYVGISATTVEFSGLYNLPLQVSVGSSDTEFAMKHTLSDYFSPLFTLPRQIFPILQRLSGVTRPSLLQT